MTQTQSESNCSYSAHQSPALLPGGSILEQNNDSEVCLHALLPMAEAEAGSAHGALGSLDLHAESDSVPS